MTEAADNRLRLLVERVERIDEEIRGLQQDRKDVFAEAKALGYDTRVIRAVITRRKMSPESRAEADVVLETYEAAIGGHAPDPAIPPEMRQRELAIAILDEQIEGIQDPEKAEALAKHVSAILDLRCEIADLRKLEANQKKLAEGDGFEKNPLSALVRWIEKCAQHGRDAMRAGEATFQLYRGTFERVQGTRTANATSDPKLRELGLGGASKTKTKTQSATDAWLNSGLGG